MAAGLGSRYGGLKQMDPIGPSGEIIFDYTVYDALRAGFTKVVFILRREIEEAFREKVGRSVEKRIDTAYVLQSLNDLPAGFQRPPDRTKPWGTAHAVFCARSCVDVPFAAVNADDFYGAGAFRILRDHLVKASDHRGVGDYCMVGYALTNTLSAHGHVARGVCSITGEGFLSAVVERSRIQKFPTRIKYAEAGGKWTSIPASSVVSMNIWGFTPSFFAHLEEGFQAFLEENIADVKGEFYLPTIVNTLIQKKQANVKVLTTDEHWFGVTYKEDKLAAKQAILERVRLGLYPEQLWG
ncbi:MAG: nucleotidyltransferase [Candidatus Eisenbacteria sp.]|nr:nucleotidyltransferase [Candidatus Eisenbacteria bacterium]